MQIRTCLIIVGAALWIGGCDDDGAAGTDTGGAVGDTGGAAADAGGPPADGGDLPAGGLIVDGNCALLDGPSIGSGTCAASERQRVVPVELTTPSDTMEIGVAYATRRRCSTEQVYLIAPLTNRGAETYCFVRLRALSFRTASGDEFATATSAYVDGRMRQLESRAVTVTCLAPGDTGFVATVIPDAWAVLDRVVVAEIERTPSAGSEPDFALRATGYTYVPDDLVGVDVTNEGSATAQVADLSPAVLLDADGAPVYAVLLRPGASPEAPWDGLLAAGASGHLHDPLHFEGATGRLWVALDGDYPEGAADSPAPVAPRAADFDDPEAYERALAAYHNAKERWRESVWRRRLP